METFVITHIVAGAIGLLAGSLIWFFNKYGKIHRSIGLTFFISMGYAAVSAILISIFKNLIFLGLIGIFSLYFVGAGYIYAPKQPAQRVIKWTTIWGWIFRIIATVQLIVGILFMYGGNLGGGIVLSVFASLLLLTSLQDIRLRKHYSKNAQITGHIVRMMGGLIAAWTAFLVNNFSSFKPEVITWLGPTVVGVIGMQIALKKFAPKKRSTSN